MPRFGYYKLRSYTMLKPKTPMIVIAGFLILNAVLMISIPVTFDKDYIKTEMENPTTREGQVYEGLAAHNKAGLVAAKRVFLSVGIGMILVFGIVGLGGIRGSVDAPPLAPIPIGAITGGVSIWIYTTPDES